MRRKRVLVLNLVEISIEFLIFMSILFKITDHENLFVRSLRAWTRPREHLLYYYMRNFCNLIGLEQWDFSLIWNTYMWKLPTFCGYKRIIAFVRDIWHKYHSWYFKIVSNFTRLTTREITYNNFEVSPVVVMPNITPNHVLLPIQIMRSSLIQLLPTSSKFLVNQSLYFMRIVFPFSNTAFSLTWSAAMQIYYFLGTKESFYTRLVYTFPAFRRSHLQVLTGGVAGEYDSSDFYKIF